MQKHINKCMWIQIPNTNTLATPLFRYERLLTSELSSTRRERETHTILKSLSYHTMLTKLKRSAHFVEF